jgi:drug/metabolite transporter (DMT)-like permease
MEWIVARLTRLEPRKAGIFSILLAVLLLSLSDALVKNTGGWFALGQIVFLRSLVAGALIAAVVGMVSRGIRLRVCYWVWIRSLCLTAMWFCYYAALPWMSFTLVAACYYSSPVWMALMSRFIPGEAASRRQWQAVLLTAAGVVVAANPRVGELSPVTLLPVIAAVFYALAAVVTRSRCREEPSLVMALNLNITLVLASGMVIATRALLAPSDAGVLAGLAWSPLRLGDWILAAFLGLLLAIVATAVAQAYKLAPSPVVGVFDNGYLVFAAFWSVVLIGEPPTLREIAGIALIASGALLAVRRR